MIIGLVLQLECCPRARAKATKRLPLHTCCGLGSVRSRRGHMGGQKMGCLLDILAFPTASPHIVLRSTCDESAHYPNLDTCQGLIKSARGASITILQDDWSSASTVTQLS